MGKHGVKVEIHQKIYLELLPCWSSRNENLHSTKTTEEHSIPASHVALPVWIIVVSYGFS